MTWRARGTVSYQRRTFGTAVALDRFLDKLQERDLSELEVEQRTCGPWRPKR